MRLREFLNEAKQSEGQEAKRNGICDVRSEMWDEKSQGTAGIRCGFWIAEWDLRLKIRNLKPKT